MQRQDRCPSRALVQTSTTATRQSSLELQPVSARIVLPMAKGNERPPGRARKDSVLAALEVMPERWAFLVLREAFFGVRRFSEFRRSLGIARNTLTDRLHRLVDHGVLTKERIAESNEWEEYRLTEMGRDLYPVVVALMQWGDRWLTSEGPPLLLSHKGCGGDLVFQLQCSSCGAEIGGRDVEYEPGPGAVRQGPKVRADRAP